jgi:putative redox protein
MAPQAQMVAHAPEGTEKLWQEFRKPHSQAMASPGLQARVTLTQPQGSMRQFVVETGSGHHLIVDDAKGATGAKPIELVAAALAGCTAFDVITVLRNKRQQHVDGYEVRVEADQAERPPQVFVAIRIHHIVTGHKIDPAAVDEAIRISEEKYCSVEAMLKHTATITTTFEIVEEPSPARPPLNHNSITIADPSSPKTASEVIYHPSVKPTI